MDLKDILAISGYPGLYKKIKETKTGVVVESLENKKRIHAFASSKISALEDIAIYTEEEDVELVEVFKKIFEKENGGQTIDHKISKEELLEFFTEVLPNFDKTRVYASDIKRVVNWYNILHKLDMVSFEEENKEDESESGEEKSVEENSSEKDNEKTDNTEQK
jgi:hypothetical protein